MQKEDQQSSDKKEWVTPEFSQSTQQNTEGGMLPMGVDSTPTSKAGS